jgi:hypothetical protein
VETWSYIVWLTEMHAGTFDYSTAVFFFSSFAKMVNIRA